MRWSNSCAPFIIELKFNENHVKQVVRKIVSMNVEDSYELRKTKDKKDGLCEGSFA